MALFDKRVLVALAIKEDMHLGHELDGRPTSSGYPKNLAFCFLEAMGKSLFFSINLGTKRKVRELSCVLPRGVLTTLLDSIR